jgi:hypothetical protein
MRFTILITLLYASPILCFSTCVVPEAHTAFLAPDQQHWVSIEKQAPVEGSDELLPTLRLRLRTRCQPGGLVVLEGVETLCATDVAWKGNATLFIRLPMDRASHLKVKDGQAWGGVKLQVLLHEDQVKMRSWSPDHQYRLVVIEACETEDWNLYLRRADEPDYNSDMQKGWDDPSVYGGFTSSQPPLSITWTGPRRAVISVPGKRFGVTLRGKVGEVSVRWRFRDRVAVPTPVFKTLAPLNP